MIEITFRGRGGQGAFTASKIIGNACVKQDNLYSLAFPTFGPERRGAPVSAFTKIDTKKIEDRTQVQNPNYLVILDESLFDVNELKNLKDCTVFINSSKKFEEKNVISVDATKIALDILHKPITNTAMIGALFSKFNVIDKQSIVESFKDNLSPSVVDKNVELFEEVLKEVNENEKTRA
ncbi:2-oxoacid:acceptor oxidoreductase family protein [Finegoldia magna]|uniref:2-oxoacid:acceptor oxidoreductase family protein n=1 Tax=Finegoldia magna TaxID=1260 RepID=UPI001ED616BB|nr:2-oxoacid:acceptor oxidoreductase family protein [Finegoldia magna]MBS5360252.1 2-oxoacid:acceptor oxidoreductase family protein [Finegoldia magna]MBS5971814.1 2-oxoacid:acceptor oxidoreductase family protein [Finegoldia magna]